MAVLMSRMVIPVRSRVLLGVPGSRQDHRMVLYEAAGTMRAGGTELVRCAVYSKGLNSDDGKTFMWQSEAGARTALSLSPS
eukprot:3132941-Rhodomonas_salina.1